MSAIALSQIPSPPSGMSGAGVSPAATRRAWITRRLEAAGHTGPLKVLIGSNSLGAGGAERQILGLIPQLRELGLAVVHCYHAAPHTLAPEFAAQQIDSVFLDRHAWGPLRYWRRAAGFIRRQDFEIVHAFNGTANAYLRGAAAMAGVPVLIAGWRAPLMPSAFRYRLPFSLLNPLTRAWVINARGNTAALERLWWMGRPRTYLVPNGLDFGGREYRDPAPIDPDLAAWIADRKVVAAIGTIKAEKNYDLLLDAAARLRARAPQLAFLLAGGPAPGAAELAARLARRIEHEKLSAFLRAIGPVADVAGLLPHAALLVLTSDSEGCPNVVLEALRAAVPVVMTRCCDTALLVEEGVSGFVVPRRDPAALADRIADLVFDEERRRAFGARGRVLAERNFDLEESAWALARLYLWEWEGARTGRAVDWSG